MFTDQQVEQLAREGHRVLCELVPLLFTWEELEAEARSHYIAFTRAVLEGAEREMGKQLREASELNEDLAGIIRGLRDLNAGRVYSLEEVDAALQRAEGDAK